MLERAAAIAILDQLHAAQNEFYSGGADSSLHRLLAPNIAWTVPGNNSIAGRYRGIGEVMDYFRRRRDLANRSFQIVRRDVLVGEGNRIAALNDGVATIDQVEHQWSTVGLYDVIDLQIAACWLLPLDQRAFDAIWSIPATPP